MCDPCWSGLAEKERDKARVSSCNWSSTFLSSAWTVCFIMEQSHCCSGWPSYLFTVTIGSLIWCLVLDCFDWIQRWILYYVNGYLFP